MVAKLKSTWFNLCQAYSKDDALIEVLWKEIQRNYSQFDRKYHNLDHIGKVIELSKLIKEEVRDYNLLLFALYYHDVIYDPFLRNNEERSALFAKRHLLQLGLTDDEIKNVQQLIMCTANHQLDTHPDSKFIIDLDLSILGSSEDHYEKYRDQIRSEYRRIPDNLFNAGRLAFIHSILERTRIFHTDYFSRNYEFQARKNLLSELEQLNNSTM